MSAFSGRQGKGAKRRLKEIKRAEAEQRQADDTKAEELLREIFEEATS